MDVIRDKELQDPEARIISLKAQLLIIEAEKILLSKVGDRERLRGKGFQRWNLVRHLGYWLNIKELRDKGKHVRALKTHTENYCVCSILDCKNMESPK